IRIGAYSTSKCVIVGFFFSSSRRHTSWPRGWSSDVCSSDLTRQQSTPADVVQIHAASLGDLTDLVHALRRLRAVYALRDLERLRSEERRVGKACRSRWSGPSRT